MSQHVPNSGNPIVIAKLENKLLHLTTETISITSGCVLNNCKVNTINSLKYVLNDKHGLIQCVGHNSNI